MRLLCAETRYHIRCVPRFARFNLFLPMRENPQQGDGFLHSLVTFYVWCHGFDLTLSVLRTLAKTGNRLGSIDRNQFVTASRMGTTVISCQTPPLT